MSDLDRLVRAFRTAVRESVPQLGYLGAYEYRVAAESGDRRDLQVVERGLGLPDLVRVPARPGVAGAKAELSVGAMVLVSFANGDPTRPFVAFLEAPGGAGYLPITSTIDATNAVRVGETATDVHLGRGLGRVLREGDTLTLTGVQPGLGPATGVVALVTLGLGVPNDGGSKVKA